MAALKPRAPSGPLEAVLEGRVYVVRIPMQDGDGRVVLTLDADEAEELGKLLIDAL